MRRRAPDERVEPWRERYVRPQAERIYQQLAGWAECIDLVDPDRPCRRKLLIEQPSVGNRYWLWPRGRRPLACQGAGATVHLVAGGKDDLVSPGVELLQHIREAFGKEDVLWTETLLDGCTGDPNHLGKRYVASRLTIAVWLAV